MPEIRKAVIPVAGLGTRLLPASKAIPKELAPIGAKPTLHYVVEEAIQSGIKEIIFITSPIKTAIEDYFNFNTPYCYELEKVGKGEMLNDLKNLFSEIKITYVEQTNPNGLGDAILRAKTKVGNEPFAVLLPDVVIISKTPCTKQLIEAYETVDASVNAAESVPKEKISSYGIYDLKAGLGNLREASAVVEKPSLEDAPSDISVVGRYVFSPKVFDVLGSLPPGQNGEIQLADAQNTLASKGKMYAYIYDGFQLDTGDELGYLKASLYLANKKYPNETKEYLNWLNNSK